MERTTAGSDSERNRGSGRRHERDDGSSGDAGRGSVAVLHGAVGNQAVQQGTSGADRSRATGDDGASTAGFAEGEAAASVVQRQTTASSSGSGTATDGDRDATGGLCSRCTQRYRAGKPLDCPDCEAALQRSVDPAARNGTAGGVVQPKLAVSRPGDPAEREAERVAERVTGSDGSRDVAVSRRATGGGGTVDGDTESRVRAATRGGRPLPEPARSTFESRFGRDFSDVRVHTGPRAEAAARSIDAAAFTHGSDIVFARGNYRPNAAAGRQLLAHELTHVVQQNGASAGSRLQRQSEAGDSEFSSPPFRGQPTLEAVLAGERTLSGDGAGRAVMLVQRALLEAGHDVEVTGEFGLETQIAVKEFKKKHKISSDLTNANRVDAATVRALDEEFPDWTPPTTPGAKNPKQTQWDPHDPTCLLDIFCEWNEPIIKDFRDGSVPLVTFTEAYNRVWKADEQGWSKARQSSIPGFVKDGKVYVERGLTCWEAAVVLYQEWFHTQQPSSMGAKEREVEAWTAQERWLIAQDLPPTSSDYRQTNSTPPTVDISEIRDHIKSVYGNVDKDGEEPGDVQPQTDEKGRPLSKKVIGEANVDTSRWECPGQN